MGSDGARVTLPVEKGKRGARAICRSELASRAFDLGEPLAAFVPRQRLQVVEGAKNVVCGFTTASQPDVATRCSSTTTGGGGHAICRSELARDLLIFSTGEKKDLDNQGLSLRWCPEGDSNSHFLRKRILNPPRLPIPPSGLNGGEV